MNNGYQKQQPRDLSHKPFQSPVFGEQCNNSSYIYNDVYQMPNKNVQQFQNNN